LQISKNDTTIDIVDNEERFFNDTLEKKKEIPMTEPTDPKYINVSDDEKIRYFFNWLIEKTGMEHDPEDIEDIINNSIQEWDKVKMKYPGMTVDNFISHLAEFCEMSIAIWHVVNEMVSNIPTSPRFSNN